MPLNWFEPAAADALSLRDLYNRQQEINRLQATYNVADAQKLAELSGTYPNLHPALLGAATVAQMSPGPELDALAMEQVRSDVAAVRASLASNTGPDAERWGFNILDDFARFGKGAIRNTFLAFDTAWEEIIQRPLRTAVGVTQGLSTTQAYEQAGASVGARAIGELMAGRPVNLGSGFFAQSELSDQTSQALMFDQPADGYRGQQSIYEASANAEQAQLGIPITDIATAERERIQLTSRGGRNIPVSPGRLLAVQFTEPGTLPFKTVSGLTDVAANIFIDPTNVAGGFIGDLKAANRFLLPQATYNNGTRPGVMARTWDEWVSSRPGRNVVNFLARNNDYLATHALLKSSNHVVDAGLAAALTRETNPQRIATLLSEAASGKYTGRTGIAPAVLGPQSLTGRMLGTSSLISPNLGAAVGGARSGLQAFRAGENVAEAARSGAALGRVGGLGVALSYTSSGTYMGRMAALVGGRTISITDLDEGTEQFGQLLLSFGFDRGRIGNYMQRFSELPAGEFESAMNLVSEAMTEFGTALKKEGIPGPAVDSFVKIFQDNETFRRYWTNQAGNPQYFPGGKARVMIDGKWKEVSAAQLFSEFLNQAIPIPDARSVRRAMRRASISRLGSERLAKIGIKDWDDMAPGAVATLADEVMNRVWKPMVLLRVAWPVRVIGEEQARMWAGGLSSMYNHPIHWLAMALSKKTGVMADDLMQNPMNRSREFRASQSRAGTGSFAGPRARNPEGFLVVPKHDPQYGSGQFIEFNQLVTDELTPIVVRGGVDGTLDDIKERFFRGDLRSYLERLIRDGSRWDYLSDKTLADGYIDSLWARANQISGGRFRYLDMRDQQWYDDLGNAIPIEQIPLADGSLRQIDPSGTRPFISGSNEPGTQNPFDYDPGGGSTVGQPGTLDFDLPDELVGVGDAWTDTYAALDNVAMTYQADASSITDGDIQELSNSVEALLAAVQDLLGDSAVYTWRNRLTDTVADIRSDLAEPQDLDFMLRDLEADVLGAWNRNARPDGDDADLLVELVETPVPEREYVPFIEAQRLSNFARRNRGMLTNINKEISPLARFTPTPAPQGWITDGVVRLPYGSTHDLNTVIYGGQVQSNPAAMKVMQVMTMNNPDDQVRAAVGMVQEIMSRPHFVRPMAGQPRGQLPQDIVDDLSMAQAIIRNIFGDTLTDNWTPTMQRNADEAVDRIVAEMFPDAQNSERWEIARMVVDAHGSGDMRGAEFSRILRRAMDFDTMEAEADEAGANLLAYVADGQIHGYMRLSRDKDGRVQNVSMLQMSEAAGGQGVKALFDEALKRGDFQPDDVLRLTLRDLTDTGDLGKTMTMEEWLRRQPALQNATREAMVEGGMTSEMRVRKMTKAEFTDHYTTLQSRWYDWISREVDTEDARRALGIAGDEANGVAAADFDTVLERLRSSESSPHDIQALLDSVSYIPEDIRRVGNKLVEYQSYAGVTVAPGGIPDPADIFLAIAHREGVTKLRKPPEEWTYDDVMEMIQAHIDDGKLLEAAPGKELLTERGAATMETGARMLGRRSDDLNNRAFAQNWDQHRAQYELMEPGNPELMEAIASGRFRGMDLNTIDTPGKEDKVIAALKEIGAGPAYVKVPHYSKADNRNGWDDAISTMFSMLMGRPTNMLSRSPAFRQYYWKRVSQMMPYMSPELREEVVKVAAREGIDAFQVKGWFRELLGGVDARTRRALEDLGTPGVKFSKMGTPEDPITSLAEMDEIAKAFALNETKSLLYDLNTKHNFFDMTRHIFPFGEAWLEIIQTWSKLMVDNPKVLRRLQQTVEGARRSGFFYPDPSTGEEVFNYPGSELFAEWMFGEQEPGEDQTIPQFTGRVAGLNIALGSFMPGVGPVVQFPLSVTGVLNDPAMRDVRDLVLPFGAMETDSPGAVVDDMLPAWFRRFLVALDHPSGDDQRLYTNTVVDVYRGLILSGEASDDTPEATQAALDQARKYARVLFLYRSAAQFFGPTGAQVRFDVRDEDGKEFAFTALSEEYRRILENTGYEQGAAFDEFTKLFGFDPTLFYVAKTRSLVRRSVTEPGQIWQTANDDLFKPEAFPLTAYYGRPDNPHEEFDYSAYLVQLKEGTRVALSENDWVAERNDLLGRLAYERARSMLDGRTDTVATDWLRSIRAQLMERFPGYRVPRVGLEARPSRDMLIREFEGWSSQPRLANTDAGRGLAIYLDARQRAMDEAVAMGLTPAGFARAKSTRHLRDWLRTVAESAVAQHPDFGLIWDSTFRAEIEEVDEIESAAMMFNLEELIGNGSGSFATGTG